MFKKIFSALVFLQVSVPNLVFAQQTLGDIGENIADNGAGIARAIMTGAFVGGLGFVIWGLFNMRTAKEQRQPLSGPLFQVVLGMVLLGVGTFIAVGSTSIFGSNEAVGLQELGL